MARPQQHRIDEESAGQRLDVYIGGLLPELSRAFIQKLCEQSAITVNDQTVKAGHRLRCGNKITIAYDPTTQIQIPDITLPVIYEDADCVVINKPVGVLTHARGGTTEPEASVASFLRRYVNGLSGERAGIVHRLDRATSGVIMGAKTPGALSWLQKQFSQRKAKKTYLALVLGHLQQPAAMIDMPIERNPKAPATFRVGANGKTALTRYTVIEESAHYSLIKLNPDTGRTHQLRVHLQQLGHPIVGDTLYDGQPADRLYLHAESLEITLPSRERKTFTIPLPEAFRAKLDSDNGAATSPSN